MKQRRNIVLASRSPARFKLLKDAGLKVTRAFADIDESYLKGETINRHALRLAREKARVVAEKKPGTIIIAADTIIVFQGKVFGKPKNKIEAARMLKKLSGKWHEVHTGTVLLDAKSGHEIKKLIVSKVRFARLSDEIIKWYVSTGEPMNGAGAYRIQKKGASLVEEIKGCYTNIVGISVSFVLASLKNLKAI